MATPAEIAASLTMDDIPIKLRCAACNKLANNAFRMPCCDQSICEDCQSSLPEACPVCLHEPVDKDDCRPNKALRTTIKVFLRKKGMEREAARKKEMLEKVPATAATLATPLPFETPAHPTSQTPVPQAFEASAPEATPNVGELTRGSREPSQAPPATNDPDVASGETAIATKAQRDVPQQSIESPGPQGTPRRASTQTEGDGSVGQDKAKEKDQQQLNQQAMGQSEKWASGNGVGQGIKSAGFGFDGTSAGFPSMGFNGVGDMNQMMPFMQTGMPNNMMGSFPNMMGMPGMGIDPMTMSQGMYGGFGGPGMGMNGMNMGMGFNAGQGAFGGFNGQSQAWNQGQDKFNQNAYGGRANGMGGGDFGANAGYGGYNMPPHEGNFNQVHHHQYPNNDFQHGYHNQGFQNRGRGRGRGGYPSAGRGRGYAQGPQGNAANHEPFHQQTPQQPVRRGSPQYTPMQGQQGESPKPQQNGDVQKGTKLEDEIAKELPEEKINRELDPGDAEDNVENLTTSPTKNDNVESSTAPTVNEAEVTEQSPKADSAPAEETKPAPIPTFVSGEISGSDAPFVATDVTAPSVMLPPPSPLIPTGPATSVGAEKGIDTSPQGRISGRGFHRGVIGYRGASQGRGAGRFSNIKTHHTQPATITGKPIVAPTEPKGLGVEGAPTGPKALRQGLPNTGVRPEKGFSIVGRASAAAQNRPKGNLKSTSPNPERSHSRTRSRSRSKSPSRHHSAHRRHHRHRSGSPSRDSEREKRRDRHERHARKYDDSNGDARETRGTRTRDVSADSSAKRSSHRGHRDYDREKDKDSTRSSHRAHRSRRDRSRDTVAEHRSSRKRSKSPDHRINGASRLNGSAVPSTIDHREKEEDEGPSTSRKRRERDGEEQHRDRKRSKREEEYAVEDQETHRRKHSKRGDKESRSNEDREMNLEKNAVEKPQSPPKGPKIDQHALEREARNRERQMKEIQRRALMEGKGAGAKGKDNKSNGRGSGGGRRMSYKYEDDETHEARASRVESEREAGRWG